jgi:hypothetical protein
MNTLRLPVIDATISDAPDGKTIRAALNRHPRLVKSLTLARSGVCLVHVAAEARDYSAGSSKQTLRRKVRAAQKSGVTWRSVDEPAERRALLNRIHQVLPTKSNYAYTNDNSALLDSGLWTVALGPDGEPLVVAVTPVDGEWALLQFCNALGETRLHSDARYLLTQVVVERLSGLGVRYLFDGVAPHRLSAGLWHFQRMIGFKMARVRAGGPGAGLPAPSRWSRRRVHATAPAGRRWAEGGSTASGAGRLA